MKPIYIAPSILAANFANLADDVKSVESAEIDYLHVDIMDGHFVPNISFGSGLVKTLRSITKIPLDVHLMIQNPERYIDSFIDAGADVLTIHLEAQQESIQKNIDTIKTAGCKTGLAINPSTSLELAFPYLKNIDRLLCMTVNPGFCGQSFMENLLGKISQANDYRIKNSLNYDIEVDGGLAVDTVGGCVKAGADVIVAGSSIFAKSNIPQAVEEIKQEAARALSAL